MLSYIYRGGSGALALFIAILSTPPIQAWQQQPPKSVCATDDNFRSFDFWLGHWAVSPWAGGDVAGHNTIESIEGGCAIEESWVNATGGTGRSINFYNPNTGTWRQVWISNGYSIDIEGGLKDGAMTLTGTIHYYRQKNSVPFRGTWTPQSDGSVRQFFEQYNAADGLWVPWFDGRYVKLDKAP